jgi:transposase
VVERLRRKKGAVKGYGKIYFVDAAHLLHNAVPSQGWIKRGTTVELKTNSGRNRLNVLGAYSPDDHTLVSIEGIESCDAELVCQLLRKLRAANPRKRLLLVLDNARYQRASIVQVLAQRLRIRLLFLPPYSPNLNLIERFWKFLRKQVLRNTYYATFVEFQAAIQRVLTNLDTYAEDLTTLMTENFHLFSNA